MRDFLEHLCRTAGGILRSHAGDTLERTEKTDEGFATQADLASEQYLMEAIGRRCPDAQILAEESGQRGGTGALRFIIDPLDGTTNFANGVPHFAVSIGVETDDSLSHAAIYNPATDELFTAERGLGAWKDGEPIRVGDGRDMAQAVIATGDYYYRDVKFDRSMSLLTRVYRSARTVRIAGSVALALAYVAAGRFDGFWQERVHEWDAAAGVLLITEAGGVVHRHDPSPESGTARSLVAANPALLPTLLATLA